MKKRHLFIFFLTLLALGFFLSQDSLARFLWHNYGFARAALILDRGDAPLAMDIGRYFFNGGTYDMKNAEQAFKKALSINPRIVLGHYYLARINFTKSNFNLALEEINKELEINPSNLRSLYIRGLIYGYAGDLAKAEKDFSRFIQWAPKEWAGYNDLAWILLKEEKYEEARTIAAEGIQQALNGKKNAWLWNTRGVTELNLDLFAQARNSFEHALILAQDLTLADWQRSYSGNDPAYTESGLSQFKEAIETNLYSAQEGIDK